MTHPKDACPECGSSKGIQAARCKPCAGRARRTSEHGTESRYTLHRRDGEPPCEACQAAHRLGESKRGKARSARRRREREARRQTERTCPKCGGHKSRNAKVCRECVDHTVRRKRRAQHGTDAGYYRHVRQARQPLGPGETPGWPRIPCEACRAAHSKANRERQQGRPRTRRSTPRPKSRRTCLDCGASVSERARRCRRCARLHHVEQSNELPIRWRRVGLIWKAA